MKKSSRGVAYMAWGENAIREAEASMQTLWQHSKLPVLVVGDEAAQAYFAGRPGVQSVTVHTDPFDATRRDKVQFLAGRVKPLLYGLSPWDETLYVDADSAFRADPKVGFELLDRWDFVLAETETRTLADSIAGAEETLWTAHWLETPHLLYHNSGMLFWRKSPAVERLFELWSEEWHRFEGWDEQVALLRALLRSDVLYLTVPYTWNCRFKANTHLLYHRFGIGEARQIVERDAEPDAMADDDPDRLIRVQIGHRRWIQCRSYEADLYRERYGVKQG